MAVQEIVQSSLQLGFQEGIDPISGDAVVKRKSFNNVKPDATAEQLYTIATAFESLQQHPLYEINRRDTSEIQEA